MIKHVCEINIVSFFFSFINVMIVLPCKGVPGG